MSYRHCLLIALLLPFQVFAQTGGRITFTEGKVRVIRDASLLAGAQGAAVEVADIIETTKPGFALVEFPDGTVIALGDATRIMINRHPFAGKTGTPEILLLDGWLKVQSRAESPAYGVSSPVQSVSVKGGSLIIHGTDAGGEVFVESGSASVGTTDKQGRPAGMATAKSGQFITRAPDKLPVSQPRASDTFLGGMPGAFKDALPARLERFKDRNVESKLVSPVGYGDISDWLTAASSWRAGFVKRFDSRVSDPAFRQQMEARMKSHPEWDRVLHPLPAR